MLSSSTLFRFLSRTASMHEHLTAPAAGASGGEEAPAPAPSPPGKGSRAARKKGRAGQT